MGEATEEKACFNCEMQMFYNAISGLSLEWFSVSLPWYKREQGEQQNEIILYALANRGSIESFCWCWLLPAQNSFYAMVVYLDGSMLCSLQSTCMAP